MGWNHQLVVFFGAVNVDPKKFAPSFASGIGKWVPFELTPVQSHLAKVVPNRRTAQPRAVFSRFWDTEKASKKSGDC